MRAGYNEYITESFPPESPEAFGLHTNAEIAFRLDQVRLQITRNARI